MGTKVVVALASGREIELTPAEAHELLGQLRQALDLGLTSAPAPTPPATREMSAPAGGGEADFRAWMARKNGSFCHRADVPPRFASPGLEAW